jgi:hypothetical protein
MICSSERRRRDGFWAVFFVLVLNGMKKELTASGDEDEDKAMEG